MRYMDTIKRDIKNNGARPQELEICSVLGDQLTWKSLQGEKKVRRCAMI